MGCCSGTAAIAAPTRSAVVKAFIVAQELRWEEVLYKLEGRCWRGMLWSRLRFRTADSSDAQKINANK